MSNNTQMADDFVLRLVPICRMWLLQLGIKDAETSAAARRHGKVQYTNCTGTEVHAAPFLPTVDLGGLDCAL